MTPMQDSTKETIMRISAVSCFAVAWISAAVISAAARASDTGELNGVSEKAMYVSLPVFITSIIGTAAFTWMIAKYDNLRLRKQLQLEHRIEILEKEKERVRALSCQDL